jgi:hypothetical protein
MTSRTAKRNHPRERKRCCKQFAASSARVLRLVYAITLHLFGKKGLEILNWTGFHFYPANPN